MFSQRLRKVRDHLDSLGLECQRARQSTCSSPPKTTCRAPASVLDAGV